jgi:5'-deoxynucleotidase YfbR-like HD superfamily hydrolase
MNNQKLASCIFDSIASKRVVKTGYVRQPGGIYMNECDTIAAHSNAVSVLALQIAFEYADEIKDFAGVALELGDIAMMSIFHDFGETRSGDTGALSKSVYPDESCKLHYLEREGLVASLSGLKIEPKAVSLFDDYRKYGTPEAIVVHVADNLEGFEKALHCARGSTLISENALEIIEENFEIYNRKKDQHPILGKVCDFLVIEVLSPGVQEILKAYRIEIPRVTHAIEKYQKQSGFHLKIASSEV